MNPILRNWLLLGTVTALIIGGAEYWFGPADRTFPPPATRASSQRGLADNSSQSELCDDVREKPKFFDSDRLMKMLAQAGISARWGGDLMVKGDMIEGVDPAKLANVLLICVDTPLTKAELQSAASTAGNFFSSQSGDLQWKYDALAIQADRGDRKISSVPINYPTSTPKVIVTDDSNYDVYKRLVYDLVERDELQNRGDTLSKEDRSRLDILTNSYPSEKIIQIDHEPILPFLPNGLIYKDRKGLILHIVLAAPLFVLKQKEAIAEDQALEAELRAKADNGESPRFTRGGIIFNERTTENGVDVIGPRIGHIRGSEDDNVLEKIWKAVNTLPIKERTFITHYNLIHNVGPPTYFRLSIDPDGQGQREVYVAIISPLEKEWTSPDVFNHENGLTTNLVIREGLVRYAVSDQTVTKIDYDEKTNIESATTTYANVSGSRDSFLKLVPSERDSRFRRKAEGGGAGNPLAETRTTHSWYSDPTEATIENTDPYKPVIERQSIDYRNGKISADTYGQFYRPIKQVTKETITYNFFNKYGIFVGAEVDKNPSGVYRGQPDYNERGKLELKYKESTTVRDGDSDLSDAPPHKGYVSFIVFEPKDRGRAVVQVVDNRAFYRELATNCEPTQPNGKAMTYAVTTKYNSQWGNLVPSESEIYAGDKLTTKLITTAYDALTGVRTAERVDVAEPQKKTIVRVNTWDEGPMCGYDYIKESRAK